MNNKDLTKDITKKLQDYIYEQQKNGHTPDMNELNRYMSVIVNAHNSIPKENFEGFSPEQMARIVNDPFGDNCPVQISTLSNEEIEEIPFLKQTLYLMHILEKSELKLTARNYIPPRIVEELYGMGLEDWNSNYYKKKTEPNVEVVQVLRIALNKCGLIKVRVGKMSLTAKGKKILSDYNALLHTLMQFMFLDYNVAYFDLYPDMEVGNVGRLYSLWLLHKYGDIWREQSFYTDKYFNAFSQLMPCNSYEFRTFNRLFHHIGLCEINDKDSDVGRKWMKMTRKRDILDRMFSFVEPK